MDKVDEAINDWYILLKENNIDYSKLKAYLNSDLFINEVGKVVDDNNNNYVISKSPIHGKGVFANKDINKNEIIGVGYNNNTRTLLGRYTNHSSLNNAKFFYKENKIILKAEQDILFNEEILVNYRDHLLNKSFI